MWAGSVGTSLNQLLPGAPWGCPGPEESCPQCLLSSSGCSTWEHWPPIPHVFSFPKVAVCLTPVCRARFLAADRLELISLLFFFPFCPVAHISGRVVRTLGRHSSLLRKLKLLLCARSLKVFQWQRGKEEKGVCCSLGAPVCAHPFPSNRRADECWWPGAGGGSDGCSCSQRDRQDNLCPAPHLYSLVTDSLCRTCLRLFLFV